MRTRTIRTDSRRVLAVAAIVALGTPTLLLSADEPVVRRGSFTSRLVLTGELVAENAIHIVVPNANIWPVQVRWLAEDGTEIAAGETIVEFDNSQLASNLEQLEQGAIAAANSLASLEAEVHGQELEAIFALRQNGAELEKARIDAAVPDEILSQRDHEERLLALRRAELEYQEASEALGLQRAAGHARVERQRIDLGKARTDETRAREGIHLLSIQAPQSGVLLVAENPQEARPFQTGDTTWPGMTIATLPKLSSMIVEAKLYDVDDGLVEVGMPVSATLDAFPDERWTGTVTAIDGIAVEINRRSLRRAFRLRIRLDDLDVERMRPGMSVQAVIEGRLEGVLVVPRTALRWRRAKGLLEAEARGDGGDWRPVRLGACNPQECIVLEGLSEGARLARATAGAMR